MNPPNIPTPRTDEQEFNESCNYDVAWSDFARTLERENVVLRQAVDRILRDFELYGQSTANFSDGEYTQDYTTRKELLRQALTPPTTI